MIMLTSGAKFPEIQSKSRSREHYYPTRAAGMRDFSTTLPVGQRQTSNPPRRHDSCPSARTRAILFENRRAFHRDQYRRSDRRRPGRQAEALQDALDRRRRMIGAHDPHAPATAIALKDVQRTDTFHELGPAVIPRPALALALRVSRTIWKIPAFVPTV